MRVLIYTDVHLSEYSSIIREKGKRLSNIVRSVNWAEQLASIKNCQEIICLGDFFDRAELKPDELTALSHIMWNKNIPHTFLVGNHEMQSQASDSSSAHVLNLIDCVGVIDDVCSWECDDKTSIVYIPYILESERKTLEEYINDLYGVSEPDCTLRSNIIVFSHNDLQMQYGEYKSTIGFDLKDIKENCSLFINGHLHNRTVNSNVINVGNLTGQNFTEDASKYSHGCMILDTDTLQYEFIENPFAFNFYKLDFTQSIPNSLTNFFKNNAVVSVKVREKDVADVREMLDTHDLVYTYRITTIREVSNAEVHNIDLHSTDHRKQFSDYIVSTMGNSNIIQEELSEVLSL